jgi:RNA chaperone Hfq
MQTRTSQGQNFQDTILANLCERRAPATLYLNNRMALHGRILDFDAYVLLLEPADGGPVQMIYKSAVVSVTGPPQRRGGPRRPYGDGPRPGGYRDDRPREGRPPYGGGDRGPRPEWRDEGRPRPQGGGYSERGPRPQGGGYGGDRGPRPYGSEGGPRPPGDRPGFDRRGPWQDRPPRSYDGPPSRGDEPRRSDEDTSPRE